MNELARSRQLFNAGRRRGSQIASPKAAAEPQKVRPFGSRLSEAVTLGEIFAEGANREAYRAFLERAASTISARADDITSDTAKQAFLSLATTLRESIPPADTAEEDVTRMIGLLIQRIESTQDADSDHLKVIKRHLIGELEKLRTPADGAAPAAPAPAAAEPAPAAPTA